VVDARAKGCGRPVTPSSSLDAAGRWLRLGHGLAASLLVLLCGCAASTPAPSPADYPFHSVVLEPAEYPSTYPAPSVTPQIQLHWRLTEGFNRVRADGLIERQQESQIMEVWLQLVGLDASDRTVSFTPPTRFAWRSPGPLDSFAIALTPRGAEKRYDVRLYMFEFSPQLTGSH
jgi:hypothetical protein